MVFTRTRPAPVSIGTRRRPEPGRWPVYIRVDTVHQGDLDGVKGEGLIATLAGLRPRVLLAHGAELMPVSSPLREPVLSRLRRWTCESADLIVANSEYTPRLALLSARTESGLHFTRPTIWSIRRMIFPMALSSAGSFWKLRRTQNHRTQLTSISKF
jgi:hypothetical protein